MDVRRRLLAVALAVCVVALPACGGGGGDGGSDAVAYSVEDAAACLRKAGVTKVDTDAGEDLEAEGLAEKGALEGSYGKSNFAVVFEENDEKAHNTESQYAAAIGGSWQPGVPIRELLKRADNAVLVYEKKPAANAKRAIEGCFGGSPKIDADVEREFAR